ncbi:RAD50-interacting protein 1 [Geosmithia morbida]|uniref:RAD50-interacting protein 1 n=1 Tax=Geosmithia morbida TaxID=1094350 RepID=A0A9P4YZQ9_9HYPO|nr:RAD50-interacting protein 1 [Geosmithia morbida]KAF4126036.1 RAD50-interacting protein 1 [Geosmithia morbida]
MTSIHDGQMASSSLDARVEDFLDDRLQTSTDLESLGDLLANVELQRNQLQTQLDDAVKQLDEARRTAGGRQDAIQAQIDEFQQLQESIDKRAAVAASSDAPDQAIARLQGPMRKLRAVETARRYLALVQDVEALRSQARAHLPSSPKGALEPYSRLKQLASTLEEAQGDEKLHLVDYVAGVADNLWTEMKDIMMREFDAVLRERGWPRVEPASQMDDDWVAAFDKLLDLQMPEVLYSGSNPGEPLTLLPLQSMCAIFAAEFRFHFLGDRPTSDPQAVATHCFPWLLMTVEKWEVFLRDNLGHLLVARFAGTHLATSLVYVDPVCAFITAMLPVVREKVHDVARKAASKSSSLLSSFISQLMTFDDNVRARFGYDGGDRDNGWPGLTTDVLDTYFDRWFQAERDFAMDRYRSILDAPDSRNIDYEYAADGRMKPTYGAVRVTDLLRSVTSQYNRLRKVRHKVRFLVDIQVDILDDFDGRLRGSLEAYQSMTSTLGRTLHGATKEELAALDGIGGLESLAKVLGSSDHIITTLKDWGNDEFFLELWEQLQAGSAKRGSGTDYEQGQPATSTPDSDGALFDETAASYSLRRKTAQELMVSALSESHSKAFRTYRTRAQFTMPDSSDLGDQLVISPELDEPLHTLTRNLEFTAKALSAAVFRRVWRLALGKLQDQLWNEVLLRQNFTASGARQFLYDGRAIVTLVDRYTAGSGGGAAAMAALLEGMRLLSLPVEANGADDCHVMTIKRASDGVFTDNDEARKVLEELGLSELTPQNARYILQRRVENNEDVEW